MEVLGWISLGTLVGTFTLWVYVTDPSTRIRQLHACLGVPEDPQVAPQASPS